MIGLTLLEEANAERLDVWLRRFMCWAFAAKAWEFVRCPTSSLIPG